ncbi:autotransporter outer membrane beta-barrel domain-containing protein [Variovorax paradoxus]|uniref:Autotransporter outer membrane beta-barrel domain-containing protein n=1 Tax=Variovorax paradoxus TaxID=34073 RepID=A0A6I6H5Z5_VARPD|nr:autotransporter outer membrane beta-barrel domain-containing protein [Variovorax paradoxus]QGW82270.1 autotransporter outer membrane beta-barrel domain-containing protein [Variovorax paradoxus]
MNKVFRIVWNDALAAWTVVSELSRGHAKASSAASTAGAAVVLALATLSMPAAADCVAAGAAITCSTVGGTQGTTVGTGPTTAANTSVDVQPDAEIRTGNSTAISLGNNAAITVRGGATVQNISTGADSPYGGSIGANTIEFNSNSTLLIERNANVFADGTAGNSEAVNPLGSGNTIINHGTVRSTHAAIWFQANSGNNTILNTGRMEAGYVAGGSNPGTDTVFGANGTSAVDFTNKGSVIGSLNFANGNDALHAFTGSSITGHITGGDGANLLTLESEDGAASTFAPLSLSGFQTLQSNAGIWTFNVSLPGSGITSTTVNGGTLILGANASTYTGSMNVAAAGVLQSTAEFAPGAISNAGLVRFAQPTDATYAGLVTGSGGIEKTGAGVLTLTADQAFTGLTTISAGTLQLGNGGTSGSIVGDVVNNATLAVNRSDALLLSGTISGTGSLVKQGAGTTTLTAANSYGGGTALKEGRLNVGHNLALGTGTLAMDDGTTLGFVADGLNLANAIELTGNNDPVIDTGAFSETLSGNISGGGFITKLGSGTLTLSGANTHTGATNVAEGTLRAGATGTFSAASAHTVASGATLDLAGFSQTVASLANSGTVSTVGTTPGTTLTVNGAYVGSNGVLRLGTFLGDSSSVSDRLVLDGAGASASGKTSVQITQLGGLGALTTGNGIEVVSALNGATTTAQTSKDAFALSGGHVDAGAYEYRLHAADASGAGENWYLRSTTTVTTPVTPTTPTTPPATGSGGSGGTAGTITVQVPTYRAEVPLLSALPSQLRQMDLTMIGNLHQRIGDDDAKTASAAASSGSERRAWGRVIAADIDIRQQGTANPHSKGNVKGFQAGTDLFATSNWRAGVYVGQLDGRIGVNGFASGIADLAVGSNDLRSQYLGAYGTWTADSGFYADAVLQAGRHRYTAEPLSGLRSGGKGDSLMASIEVGQAFALGASGWKIEPQVQLIHQRLSLDTIAISGANVRQDSDDGWIARVGVRLKGEVATGLGTLQPYGRFNLYKASSGADVARFIGPAGATNITGRTGSTFSELAGGLTLALNQTTSVYGEVGKLWASGGDARVKSTVQGSLGLRMKW